MNKGRDPKITIAWITSGLGCMSAVCAALIGGVFLLLKPGGGGGPDTTVINSQAITQVVPTQPETTIEVLNQTSSDICFFYIMPNGEGGTSWGDNLLYTNQTIKPNTGLIFTINTGMYDYQASDCQGQVLEEVYNSHLQGTMTWIVDGK